MSSLVSTAQYANNLFLDPGSSQAIGANLIETADHPVTVIESRLGALGGDILTRNIEFPNTQNIINNTYIESPNFIFIGDANRAISSDTNWVVLLNGQISTINSNSRFRIYSNDLQLLNTYTHLGPDTVHTRMSDVAMHPQGGFIVSGEDHYYYSNGAGVDRVDSPIWRFDSTGQLLWEGTGNLQWFGLCNNLSINEQGKPYVFGSILTPGGYTNMDSAVSKFDSLGNLIEIQSWGSPFRDSGALGIPSSSNTTILCHSQTTSVWPEVLPYNFFCPIHVDQIDLETLARTPITIFPETYLNLRVTDFKEVSTGYVIAALGAYNSASSAPIAYLFWLDENGQLTHQRSYHQDFPGAVQEQFLSALYSIVEHENGWYSLCGQAANFDGSHTWVVHLDPCGDIMYSSCLVDVAEQHDNPVLNAFPNPVTNRGTLHLSGDWTHNTSIRFFNTQGQFVFEYTVPFDTNILAIPLHDLAAGIYSVHGGDRVFKVVVE